MEVQCVSNSKFLFLLLIFLSGCSSIFCWDSDELEVFDVVEEVNQNFYLLLDVPQNANQGQIKKAFRRLSLVLHPDKNDAPDAEIKFRQLVSVYDVLKDANKRKCYDDVLENGLPDWKQAVYYYRRVRKMGLIEMAVILFVIITIGQYLVGWAHYIEYKFNVEDYLSTKNKRLMRKQKKSGKGADRMQSSAHVPDGVELELELANCKPSIRNTLPFQLPRFIWFLIVEAPAITYRLLRGLWQDRAKWTTKQEQPPDLSEEETQGDESGGTGSGNTRGPRRRKGGGFKVPELSSDANDMSAVYEQRRTNSSTTSAQEEGPPIVSGGLWTDDDLADLVKLAKKFPVGTAERWERIGAQLGRPAAEVAHMAHKLKDQLVKSVSKPRRRSVDYESDADSDESNSDQSNEDADTTAPYVVPVIPKKVKTRGGTAPPGTGTSSNWSQIQQKALENALAKFPKSGVTDRWDKIAKCVPGKSKEDCMLRYKHLVELVKKKKEQDSTTVAPEVDESGTTQQLDDSKKVGVSDNTPTPSNDSI